MVLEVYEAGILEAIEDGFGGGLFGGGVTGEELVEVNQLSNVSIAWKEVYISHTGMTRSSWATAPTRLVTPADSTVFRVAVPVPPEERCPVYQSRIVTLRRPLVCTIQIRWGASARGCASTRWRRR